MTSSQPKSQLEKNLSGDHYHSSSASACRPTHFSTCQLKGNTGSITLNIAGILTQRAWVQVLMREPDPPKHAAPEPRKQRVSQGLDHLRALWVAAGNKLGTSQIAHPQPRDPDLGPSGLASQATVESLVAGSPLSQNGQQQTVVSLEHTPGAKTTASQRRGRPAGGNRSWRDCSDEPWTVCRQRTSQDRRPLQTARLSRESEPFFARLDAWWSQYHSH